MAEADHNFQEYISGRTMHYGIRAGWGIGLAPWGGWMEIIFRILDQPKKWHFVQSYEYFAEEKCSSKNTPP